jgi:hypothetical protein
MSAEALISVSEIAIEAFEYRRRGLFFAFAYGADRCACGWRNLIPLPLRISHQPLLDAARSLLAGGFDPRRRIVMVRDGQVRLRPTTIVEAAKLSVTTDRGGRPVFGRYREKRQSQLSGSAIEDTSGSVPPPAKNEPAGLLLRKETESSHQTDAPSRAAIKKQNIMEASEQ